MTITTTIAPQLTALAVPIDSVRPHPRNPNDGNVGAISLSLQQFAQYAPIVVQRSTGHIVKGNHTYLAARALGWTEIAANVMDMDDTQALAVLVGDNRQSELGTRDQDELAALLTELAEADALLGTGFDCDDVDQLIADLNAEPFNAAAEWTGMPEFAQEDLTPAKQVIVSFAHEADVERFARLIEQNVTMSTKSVWYPAQPRAAFAGYAFVADENADAD